MAVLVDSSVWIAAASPKNSECLKLKRMIGVGESILVTRTIQVEVCQGARSEEEFHRLREGFLGFECLEIDDKHWGLAAWNYFSCRKKGLTVSTMDCLIATLAREFRMPLWTLDKAFARMKPIVGFELWLSKR